MRSKTMPPRSLHRALYFLLMLVFVVPLPLVAAELTPHMSAEQVAAEAYARMRDGEWRAAADTFDPAALKQFREAIAPIMNGAAGGAMAGMFFGEGKTAADIATMTDAAFFADFIRTVSATAGAGLKGQDILGSVSEGPDRQHLVTRASAEAMGIRVTKMEVVTLNRTPQGWRLALSGELEGMAQALRLGSEAAASSAPGP
jgi:hypothetical protein